MSIKTEQAILQSIAKESGYSEWRHRDNIVYEVSRSYYTVRRYLRDLKGRGLIECSEGPIDYLEEWWRLTDEGRKHLESVG